MTSINVPYVFTAPIQERRWVRNGLIPDAEFQSGVCMTANQIARYRGKELFRSSGMCGFDTSGTDALLASTGGTDRDRWRSFCHTGPFTTQIAVDFVMCLQSDNKPFNPAGRMRVLTSGGSIVGDAVYHFGNSLTIADNVPSNWGFGTGYVNVSPDTDYQLLFSDVDNARMISATAYEVTLDPDTSNGYIQPGYAATRNIYDADRSDPMLLASSLWKRGGAHLFNWTVDSQASPQVNSLLSTKNVIDGISTGVDATTPGFTIDLTGCNRRSQSSVPVVLWAYGKWGGASGTGGLVRLRSTNTGAVLATITGFPIAGGWKSATLNLDPSKDKLDLCWASTTGGTNFSIYAASLYQLE
jgi:hypothetical protein